jgi:hypothetical protein
VNPEYARRFSDPGGGESGPTFQFDPLFIEDPLSQGNNVGRNSFRIFQIQKVFSEALLRLRQQIDNSHGSHRRTSLLEAIIGRDNDRKRPGKMDAEPQQQQQQQQQQQIG